MWQENGLYLFSPPLGCGQFSSVSLTGTGKTRGKEQNNSASYGFIVLLVVCVKCVHVFTCNWWAVGIAPVCLSLPLVGCDKTLVCLLLAIGRV